MRRISLVALLSVSLLAIGACGDDDSDATNNQPNNQPNNTEPNNTEPNNQEPGDIDEDCDPLMPDYCSMPWPSNLYLEDDADRETGYTLGFGEESLPISDEGGAVSPEGYRRLDGYGLGTPVATLFPNIDVSAMPTEEDMAPSIEDDTRTALYFEVTDDGLEPVPFWAELDAQATDPAEQILYLRPGVILEEDTRYIVAFRNLEDTDGDPIERSEAFDALLSGDTDDHSALAPRQDRFDEIFDYLDGEGIDLDELTLAWDFHTGSSDGIHGELLSIIDQGIAIADDEGIELTINNIDAYDESQHDHIAFEVEGTFRVPHFMEEADRTSSPSWLMHRDDDGNPTQNGWRDADFYLQIPHSAVDGTPHGLVKYGHGMLGSGSQVSGGFNQKMANEDDLIFFAADFIGFSDGDVPQAIQALQQPTYFEELVDRMHQGILEYVLLTQGMFEGLEDLDIEADIVVDEERIFYSGISQGGIYGVPYVAVDPMVQHGHFGVPGHNYAMLMERSSNFYGVYDIFLNNGFPQRVDQGMAMVVIQLMWDKVDPISYMRRLTAEPFDPDMPNYGIFAAAKADYQVAVVTKEITARSGIDIPILEPYDADRGTPWGVDTADYPHTGSGVILYDFGNPWPEPGNLAPDDDFGDPHGLPRQLDEHNEQMVHFFDTGEIIDVCDGEPCYFPDVW